jgi:hypothetical protein
LVESDPHHGAYSRFIELKFVLRMRLRVRPRKWRAPFSKYMRLRKPSDPQVSADEAPNARATSRKSFVAVLVEDKLWKELSVGCLVAGKSAEDMRG